MVRRLGTWLIFAATGAGLLAGMAGTLKNGPTVVPGVLLTLGAPCLLIGLVGAVWDVVRFVGARLGPSAQAAPAVALTTGSEASREGAPHEDSAPAPLDARTSQEREWDADRLRLISEGEGIAQTLRGLTLDPNDDGFKKDLVGSRTTRDAKNWIASADEFEDHWTPGGSIINRNVLARMASGMSYSPTVRVPRPPWRQQLVGQVEFRLERLKKRGVPPG